jgi:diguanylate cyclase (GGDEF)-like protein
VADQAAAAINKAQLWDMAVTDSLTGLYVRRYFLVKLQEELHRAERYDNILSVVMADLDHFKNINDTYGHDAGDRVLKAIGKFLQQNIRDVDMVARYDGEEFVVMIPEAANDAAHILSERLRKQMSQLRIEDPRPSPSAWGLPPIHTMARVWKILSKKRMRLCMPPKWPVVIVL